MKTLIVYYSKTGTTKIVADAVIKKNGCDFDELKYDAKSKSIEHSHNPTDYERVILLAPVWGFALAEPMKLYVAKYNTGIKQYDLILTCSGFGLRGCIKNCLQYIGKPPENALIFRAKNVKRGNFDISTIQ